MPYILQEILDNIIGCAAADHDYGLSFSNTSSLVFHTFHQIVLPYSKFRLLTFQNRWRLGTTIIPIPKLCEAINARDAHALSLAPLVQELDESSESHVEQHWQTQFAQSSPV